MKSDILNKNINQMLTDLNQVKTATELIGDDWVVAADDIRQFEALVPEICCRRTYSKWNFKIESRTSCCSFKWKS